MTTFLKRSGTALLSLVLLCVLAMGAGAASSQTVGVKFWKERSDKESMANSGIDADRTATLTRQANGTYTLTLPLKQVSKMGVTGSLSGLTIGDVTYDGTLTGDFEKGTASLTIKNLPASVLTGSGEQVHHCDLQHPDGYGPPRRDQHHRPDVHLEQKVTVCPTQKVLPHIEPCGSTFFVVTGPSSVPQSR